MVLYYCWSDLVEAVEEGDLEAIGASKKIQYFWVAVCLVDKVVVVSHYFVSSKLVNCKTFTMF